MDQVRHDTPRQPDRGCTANHYSLPSEGTS